MDIERIETHQGDYKPKAHEAYSFRDFGNWIHLFAERASHRSNPVKLRKDLYDAKNYLAMMEDKLRNKAKALGINYEDL